MSLTPTIWASIGAAMLASTTAAEAPGYVAVTCTCGGTMSGSCATGMRSIASAPAIVMTTATTTARRGRSTKMAEIMAFLPPPFFAPRGRPVRLRVGGWRGGRGGRDRLARADALHPLANYRLTFLETAEDDRGRGG